MGRITKQSPWLKYTRKPEIAKQNIHNYTRCGHRQNKKEYQTNTWIQFKYALTIIWPNWWSFAMGSWPRYLIYPWSTLADMFILEFYDTVTVLALKAYSYSLILITTILFIFIYNQVIRMDAANQHSTLNFSYNIRYKITITWALACFRVRMVVSPTDHRRAPTWEHNFRSIHINNTYYVCWDYQVYVYCGR